MQQYSFHSTIKIGKTSLFKEKACEQQVAKYEMQLQATSCKLHAASSIQNSQLNKQLQAASFTLQAQYKTAK
jgi:hypothetical protein